MQTSNTSDDKGFKSEEEINADFDMFMEGIEKKVQEKSHFEAIKNSDRDGREEGSPLDENEEWAKVSIEFTDKFVDQCSSIFLILIH